MVGNGSFITQPHLIKMKVLISLSTLNFRYWKENGICWAKNSEVHDIDDTAMGFRLLRLHGHDVSAGKKFGLSMNFQD